MPCCWCLPYITWLLFKCKQYPHVFQWTACKSCCALFVAGKMWSEKCTQCIRPPLVTLGPADELLFGECALRTFLLSHLSTLHLSVFHSFQWHNHIGVGAACCDDFNWRAGPTPTPSDDSESSSSCDESSNDSDDFAWADGSLIVRQFSCRLWLRFRAWHNERDCQRVSQRDHHRNIRRYHWRHHLTGHRTVHQQAHQRINVDVDN